MQIICLLDLKNGLGAWVPKPLKTFNIVVVLLSSASTQSKAILTLEPANRAVPKSWQRKATTP